MTNKKTWALLYTMISGHTSTRQIQFSGDATPEQMTATVLRFENNLRRWNSTVPVRRDNLPAGLTGLLS